MSDPSPSIFILDRLAESYPEFRSYPDIGQFLSRNWISLFFFVFSAIFCYFHVFLHALEQRRNEIKIFHTQCLLVRDFTILMGLGVFMSIIRRVEQKEKNA